MSAGKLKVRPGRGGAEALDLMADDPRYAMGQAIIRQADIGRNVVTEVFAGTPLAEDEGRIRELLGARSEVIEQWHRGQRAFLAIGRILLRLSRTLSEEEFLRLRRGSERLFPFSDSLATKFRMIAAKVDGGALPEDRLPGYSIAYELALLDDEGLRVAEARNLIRPDVRRAEVVKLRRELRIRPRLTAGAVIEVEAPTPDHRVSRERLERRLRELLAERADVAARLAKVEREVEEVRARLALVGGAAVIEAETP